MVTLMKFLNSHQKKTKRNIFTVNTQKIFMEAINHAKDIKGKIEITFESIHF